MNNKSVLLTLFSTLLAAQIHYVEAAPKCSLKTLKGTYIYGATGTKDASVYVEGGQEIFDGKGGIVNTYTDNSGNETVTTGSYSLGSNCVGKATYRDTGDSYTMYTGPTGEDFASISASDNVKIAGREVRVSKSLNPQCSLKTLKGTYIYTHTGYRNGTRYFESGQEKFDGRGNVVNVYSDANGLEILTEGTYTMDNNCIGQSHYEVNGDSYSIYTGPTGNEFSYVSTSSGQSNIAVGREHRVSKSLVE